MNLSLPSTQSSPCYFGSSTWLLCHFHYFHHSFNITSVNLVRNWGQPLILWREERVVTILVQYSWYTNWISLFCGIYYKILYYRIIQAYQVPSPLPLGIKIRFVPLIVFRCASCKNAIFKTSQENVRVLLNNQSSDSSGVASLTLYVRFPVKMLLPYSACSPNKFVFLPIDVCNNRRWKKNTCYISRDFFPRCHPKTRTTRTQNG